MPSIEGPAALGTVLLTGAAGTLGRVLTQPLRGICRKLVLSDLPGPLSALGITDATPCDLGDLAAMKRLLLGVDAVVHLGGVSTEAPFEPILQSNIRGLYNLYEAARLAGTRRIVFASSNHVSGYRRQDEVVSPADPMRPDGLYGASKAWGESLSRMYFDRYRIESACLRIGSCLPEPIDRRTLSTWLSHGDLARLVCACLSAPVLGHTIVYGMSDNDSTWWDNTSARHLGYRPQDNSERYRAALEAKQPTLDRKDPAVLYQAGGFVHIGPFE